MENTEKTAKSTQKILSKLISEETIAFTLYEGAMSAVKPEFFPFIAKKFQEIADDERNDHWASLRKFAMENGYEVPYKFKDIEKHASDKMVKLLNSLKGGENAVYYIGKAIESEVEAIASFEEAMNSEYVFELQPLLLKCYYDEIQHLEDLQLLLECASMGVVMK